MFYSQIEQRLDKSDFIKLFDSCVNESTNIQIYKLNLSLKALLIARAWKVTSKNIVIISQDDVMAEDIWDDLSVLIGKENSHYLPDYEVLPYEERSPHYSIRATRLESLTACLTSSNQVYSLSIRSLMRRLPPARNLYDNIITLQKGQECDLDWLISKLVGCGYEVEFQISKVFQVARRGGIVDVFSPSSLKPHRIEFFGDEIISIKSFSLSTQRTEGLECASYTIIPAREISLHDIDTSSQVYSQVQEHGFFDGIENYMSFLYPATESFIDYFNPDQTIVFWNNYHYVDEELSNLFEQVSDSYLYKLKDKTRRILPRPEQLLCDEQTYHQIMSRHRNFFLQNGESILPYKTYNISCPIEFKQSYNGNLSLMSGDIRAMQAEGYAVYIQFDNDSQSQRMRTLLDEYDIFVTHYIGVLHEGFVLPDAKLAIFTDHEIFNRYKKKRYAPRFAPGEALVDYESLKPNDFIVHIDHGIGVYEGLKVIRLEGQEIECLVIRFAGDDRVYVPTFQLQLVSKFVAEEGVTPVLNKIGSTKWQNTKRKAKQQIEIVAQDILKLYAERAKRIGLAHLPDNDWQRELEASFIYEDTADQIKSTSEIKNDMELPNPMERLLCGDVGFGKTEVAIRAAFKAVMSDTQVAVVVPTTLLCEQHYRVFRERLAQYPIKIALFSRFRTPAQIKKDLVAIAMGQIDIAIGTHRLFSADVHFRKLGLLIIDEEHRFGVRHKDRLRKLQANVDTLYMSATPIPRTLNMALAKLKEISLMQTSPKERLPIRTIITPRDILVIKEAIFREVDRGGQVFFIHNRVQTIETIAEELRQAMPNIRFGVGHAQMHEHALETVMDAFMEHQFDVLIATTIIENGIDIPNANTILIDRADTFGLAQLYQMRGRVGRSNRRAYAYLLIPKNTTPDAKQRLDALTQYDYLGAGFQVALRDLEIRGAGTILGTKQSGVIQSIGFNYYNHLLETAIDSIEKNQPELFYNDEPTGNRKIVKADIDLYFPKDYIEDDKEKLKIYKRLSETKSFEEIIAFSDELRDRFGKMPEQAHWLLTYFQMKVLSEEINLNSCQVKNGEIFIEFKPDHLPPKQLILQFTAGLEFPFRFDLTKGMRLIISLDKHAHASYHEQCAVAIRILQVLAKTFGRQ